MRAIQSSHLIFPLTLPPNPIRAFFRCRIRFARPNQNGIYIIFRDCLSIKTVHKGIETK